MLELIPENIAGIVVLNVLRKPRLPGQEHITGADYVVGIHNWIISTNLRYLLFDLQDEKDICEEFLEEIIQLMKRMRIPFLFSGVLGQPKVLLQSYDYGSKYPIFETPEQATQFLKTKFPDFIDPSALSQMQFGVPLEVVRFRLGAKNADEDFDNDSIGNELE